MCANHVKKNFVIEKVSRHTKTDAVRVMTMHPYTSSFDLISGLNHAWPAAPQLHSQGREVYVRPEALSVLVLKYLCWCSCHDNNYRKA